MGVFDDIFGDSLKSDNHKSPGVRAGLKFDPLAYIFGDTYRNLITKSGDLMNEGMYKLNKPVFDLSEKYDPIRGAVPELNNVMTWAENKPASTTGLLVGGYAAGGGFAGGAGAGGGASTAPAVTGVEGGLTGTGVSVGSVVGGGGSVPAGSVAAPSTGAGAGAGAGAGGAGWQDYARLGQQFMQSSAQDQNAMLDRLSSQGPPPVVGGGPANSVGADLVAERYRQMTAPVSRVPPVMGRTRGEAATASGYGLGLV